MIPTSEAHSEYAPQWPACCPPATHGTNDVVAVKILLGSVARQTADCWIRVRIPRSERTAMVRWGVAARRRRVVCPTLGYDPQGKRTGVNWGRYRRYSPSRVSPWHVRAQSSRGYKQVSRCRGARLRHHQRAHRRLDGHLQAVHPASRRAHRSARRRPQPGCSGPWRGDARHGGGGHHRGLCGRGLCCYRGQVQTRTSRHLPPQRGRTLRRWPAKHHLLGGRRDWGRPLRHQRELPARRGGGTFSAMLRPSTPLLAQHLA